MSKIFSVKHVSLVLILTALWFAGSTWWYVCETQELCGDDTAAVETVSNADQNVEEVEEVVEQPATPSFDTTRTLTAFYESDVATFTDRSWEAELQEFADYLIATPEATATIAGFTSFVSPNDNENSLSSLRAQALKDELVTLGVESSRIFTESRAGDDAVADNTTVDGQALNQRAILSIN